MRALIANSKSSSRISYDNEHVAITTFPSRRLKIVRLFPAQFDKAGDIYWHSTFVLNE